MSVEQVQSRMSQISARLQALSGGTPGGVVGGPVGPTSFASALADVRTTAAAEATQPEASTTATRAVALAKQQIGTPYVFGGEAPGGFDCSGLIQWTYGQLGVTLPRVSGDQGRAGTAVSPADARPGDLVYFDRQGSVDHIGIYNGDGTWIVAPHTGAQVRIEKVDLAKATSIRRVTGDAPALPSFATGSAAGPAWSAALPAAGQRLSGAVQQAAEAAGIDPRLLSAVAWTESGFNTTARSGAGAQGLMQLMPRTAQGLGVDPLDPAQALAGGARYLRQQLDAFGGRTDLALAAYNAGPTAVRKHGGVPPYSETQNYITKVLDRYRLLGGTS